MSYPALSNSITIIIMITLKVVFTYDLATSVYKILANGVSLHPERKPKAQP